ncbi:YpzI family protein [Anaerobacillus sp. MEB173]
MGQDRQVKKSKQSRKYESDRDQSLHYPGAAKMESPEEARKRQRDR